MALHWPTSQSAESYRLNKSLLKLILSFCFRATEDVLYLWDLQRIPVRIRDSTSAPKLLYCELMNTFPPTWFFTMLVLIEFQKGLCSLQAYQQLNVYTKSLYRDNP